MAVLSLRPLTLREARRYADQWHSHLERPQGGIVAVGVEHLGELVCVALLGRPSAQLLQSAGGVAEVTRVASDGSTRHAASMALAAITRAGLALGWRRLVSYTLLGEAGTIYRACAWRPTSLTRYSANGEYARPSRERQQALQPGRKVRWEAGPDALPLDTDADWAVRECVGKIGIPPRRDRSPLFAGARWAGGR